MSLACRIDDMETSVTHAMTPEEEVEALRNFQASTEARNAQIDQEAKTGDEHTLDVTVHTHIPVLTFRYINTTIPLVVIEAEVHYLWYTVIQGAKYWKAANAKQDTLVRYLLHAKSKGTLTRPRETIKEDGDDNLDHQHGRLEVVPCSDGGKFWSDLPLFGQDLVAEWTNRYYQSDYDDDLRSNLAAFVGRLVSVGIYNGPAACVLSLFSETLERPRPLVSAPAADVVKGANDAEAGTGLSIENLIHALRQMLIYGEGSIIVLSNDSVGVADGNVPPDSSGLGELAIQSRLSSPGFNPDRWRFWIQRLEELAQCEDEAVAGSARVCVNCMRYASEAIYGPLAGKPNWEAESETGSS
ncbi:hypothetical protein ACCO45_004592 [Purpureocillium lilacinum]|uniref:Uncharacterized protein n=1 Tax=Purpureocillium lilacinum TaxID=33203 RepID=A0ACC4DT05_PURLI